MNPASNTEIHYDPAILKYKRILLVEDNALNICVANTILNRYGALVFIAFNGLQAVEALKTNAYDLVLMDVQMPVMDGHEATRIIRGELAQEIPIIALTADVSKGDKELCLSAGMNDYVPKPFEEVHLITRIAHWLGKMIPASVKIMPTVNETIQKCYNHV
ncbi:MAG TPA: response regulator [Puia sp.]|nr:response regulator [Puia sp.]